MSTNNEKNYEAQFHDRDLHKCHESIRIIKARLVVRYPFFGILASGMDIKESKKIPTMGTDGKTLYYNPAYIIGVEKSIDDSDGSRYKEYMKNIKPDLTEEQLDTLCKGLTDRNMVAQVTHQILHCIFRHFLRRSGRDLDLWDRSCDYAINSIIQQEHIGTLPDNSLLRDDFTSMGAEEIFARLKEEQENGGGGGGGTYDYHMSPERVQKDGGANSDGEATSVQTFEEMLEGNLDRFQENVRGAAQRTAGKLPAGVQRLIDELDDYKIDWRQHLNCTLRALIRQDMSFRNPSRRSWVYERTFKKYMNAKKIILPGLLPEETIDIAIAIDLSGSISQVMCKDFLTEIVGITKCYKSFKILLMTFDTQVYNPQVFEGTDPYELLEYEFHGGGGTLFECVWDHMKEEEYVPKQLIVFTDGYPCNTWGDPTYCETLFLVHTEGYHSDNKPVSTFGTTLYYEWENSNN